MKKKLLLFVLGILPFGIVLGQQADQKMLANASGGGLNSSIGNLASPNLFDGSTNISIPIYDYGNFGISLSYNTKGVAVDELSGPIGVHWNLNNGGGTITRVVKDIPDETVQSFDGPNNTAYSLLGKSNQYGLTAPANNQYWDKENDEFMVSAGSLQFTFKMGDNYVFTYPQNRCKITPVGSINSAPQYRYTDFIITDEEGVKYYFQLRDAMVAGSIAFGNFDLPSASGSVATYQSVNKWYLTKVVLTSGQEITYTYEDFPYPSVSPGITDEDLSLYRTPQYKEYPVSGSTAGGSTYIDNTIVYISDINNGSYILKSIHYPDNTIATMVFDQTNPECMKSIKQIDLAQGENCVKYRFNKAYLNTNSTNCALAQETAFNNECMYEYRDKRMILKNISILNCDESVSQPYYSFQYAPVSPPNRFGNNKDFFGYTNAIGACDPAYPNQYIAQPPTHKNAFDQSSGQPAASNRAYATDVNIVAALSLTKVTNRYGGSLSFQYELHSGLVSVTDTLPGMPDPNVDHLFLGKDANDGLRLHATIAEDKYRPGSKLITTYTYSGGQRFLNGGYYSYPSKKDANGNIIEYFVNNSWVSAHQLINGSNHGYSEVTATETNNNGQMISKTIHYFSNFKQNGDLNYYLGSNSKHYFQLPYTDKQYIMDWKIGLPLKTETFDKNNNMTSRTTNVYDMDMANDFTSAIAGLGTNEHVMRVSKKGADGYAANSINISDASFYVATDNYVPFRGKSLLLSTTTVKMVNNITPIIDVVYYEYDSRFNLSKTTTKNSKGELFKTINVFNYNVTGATTLDNMTSAGLETVVSVERWKQGAVSPANDQLMGASITTLKYENNKISTKKVQSLQSLLPISYNAYTQSGASPYNRILTAYNTPSQPVTNFQVASEVLQYDDKGNPIETQIAGQNSYQSMIWDKATGNKLAAANCKLNEMGFAGFETEDNGNWTYSQSNVVVPSATIMQMDGNKVLAAYSYQTGAFLSSPSLTPNKEYTLTFWTKGGDIQITGGGVTGGITYSNLYVNNSNGWRYIQARFTPTNNTPIQFSLFSGGGAYANYYDDVRLFPTGASMQCWNYTPFYGVSSSVDNSGRITFYEYDSFGRLVITRNQEGKIIAKKDYHLAP